jgi:hypothetical protein
MAKTNTTPPKEDAPPKDDKILGTCRLIVENKNKPELLRHYVMVLEKQLDELEK